MADIPSNRGDAERSSLWGLASGGAIAGGVGYGIYRSHPAIQAAAKYGSRDVAEETAAHLRTLGRFEMGRVSPATMGVTDDILRNLVESSSGTIVRRDIAASAYEAMLAGGRTTTDEAYIAYKNILGQGSVRSAYEQAKVAISEFAGDADLLTRRMSELGEGGFYASGRLTEKMAAGMGTGQFMGQVIAREQLKLEALAPELQEQAMAIRGRLETAAGKAGGTVDWGPIYNIEDVVEGGKVTTPMMRGYVGKEPLNIPLANKGITYGGEHLATRYGTRTAYAEAGAMRDYTEQYVDMLEQAMATQETKVGLKNSVIEANRQIIENIHARDGAARSMAVLRLPEAALPAGGRVKAKLHGMESVYVGGGDIAKELFHAEDIATGAARYEALTAGGRELHFVGSPDVVAKGTALTRNVPEEIFGPSAQLMSIEQQPLQFIRREWGATAAAKAAAPEYAGAFGTAFSRLEHKIQGPGYKDILFGGAEAAAAEAYTAPQMVAFYAKPQKIGYKRGGLTVGPLAEKMFPEEIAVAERAAKMVEYERVVPKQITLAGGMPVRQEIQEALGGLKVGTPHMFEKPVGMGKFIGTEAATGRELWAEAEYAFGQAEAIGAELTGENVATVYMRERYKLDRKHWMKFFSEEAKFMGRATPEARMGQLLEAAGAPAASQIAGQEVEAVLSGKLVQRNRMAQMFQQVEAIGMIAGRKIDAREATVGMREFLRDPFEFLKVRKVLEAGAVNADLQIQKNMIAMTKKWGFSTDEMALTFGLMDRGNVKALMAEGVLTPREAGTIARSTGVIGLFKGRLGHLAAQDVGQMGAVEQTMMRLLAMKGEEGQRFAAELGTRAVGKGELAAANLMEASVLNQVAMRDLAAKAMGDTPVDPRTMQQLTSGDLLQKTGRYVELGRRVEAFGGAKRIYIPGTAEAEGLMAPMAVGKKRIGTPVARGLEDLRHTIASRAAEEEIEKAAEIVRSRIVQASEQQSAVAQKTKIMGSRFLTGMRLEAGQGDAIRISERQASTMLDELAKRAKTDDQREFLKMQKRKVIDEGEEIVGALWRHPGTSPESMQFIRYGVDKNLADEMVAIPYQMGTLRIGTKVKDVDISPAAGMFGDFDKDMYGIAAISDRDTAARIGKRLNKETQEGYTAYLFNHYAMKDLVESRKGPVKDLISLGREEAAVQAVIKGGRDLTTAKIATPQVNIALQKMKLGIQYAAPHEYKPMAEIFALLEQAAVGGKHGAQQSEMYQDIAHAWAQKDVSAMEGVVKRLITDKDLTISGAISGPDGRMVPQTTKISPRKIAQISIDAGIAAGPDVDIAIKSARAAKGYVPEGDKAFQELVEMYYKRRTGSIDVAQNVMQTEAHGMPGFTERINRVARRGSAKTGALLRSLKKAKGPALIGAAVGVGIMLSAPSVSGELSAPKSGAHGGRNITPGDMGPPRGVSMRPPPARIMKAPTVYDMGGIRTASRANIRMSMPDADRAGTDFMRHARALAGGSRVRIQTSDDRSVLNAQRLASKIHERI